jgi:type IV pilus assembly protein PilM
MALFGIGKTSSYLGIDIGAAGIKLVEFREHNGRAKLHTYAYTERGPAELSANLLDDVPGTSAVIRGMIKKSKATAVKAVTGLPISAVFSSVLSVPKLADKEQKGAIEVQARKIISIPLEELILDSKVITSPELLKIKGTDALKNIQVLLTAAPKNLVSKYLAVFRAAGLELASLETEAFALIRSLVGKDKSTLMVIDVGALRTSVMVVVGGIPYLSRSIDVGGLKLTKAAAAALGVPDAEAESMKNDFQSMGAVSANGIPPVFEPLVNQIVAEVNFSLKLFSGLDTQVSADKTAAPPKTVEKIILTGGGSLLPNLDIYLSQKLDLRVFRGDPWARILYPDDVRPLLDEIGPRFAVAIGLAMREFES